MGGRSSKRTPERRGEANIVEALAVGLPDVFHAEILPQLELEDVLRLSRVNKTCWKAVWSEPRSSDDEGEARQPSGGAIAGCLAILYTQRADFPAGIVTH